MFKSQNDQVTVLGLCVDEPDGVGSTQGLDFCTVRSGRRAIDMLRMLSFDLVIVGMDIPDITTWDFIRRVRTGWAWQKWALVGGSTLTPQEEITARMFGSVRIFDEMPTSEETFRLASHLRNKAAITVQNQNFERPYRPAAGL